MATYVNDLRLKEIATGDESGTWGTSTNTNLELIAEAWGSGSEAITGTSHTITMADGAADAARAFALTLTGSITATNTVTLAPNTVSKTWVIQNNAGYQVTISQGTGANVVIPNGGIKMIVTDGAGSGAAVTSVGDSLQLTNNAAIAAEATSLAIALG